MNLYMQTIKNLGTKKHHPYLLRAATLEDIGCFAMTELSHGSNVQAVCTTATYDSSTQQFIINTPSEKDMKFWIGLLAKTATHAIVFAQLISKGNNEGVHAFVIKIRDRTNH